MADSIKGIDYYAILNLDREASQDDIRSAYKKLAVTYHPDHHSSGTAQQAAEEQFNLIKSAYDTLTDEHKRQLYDHYGLQGLKLAMESQVVPNYKKTQEMMREIEKLKAREEALKYESMTQSRGTITTTMSMADMVRDLSKGEMKLPEVQTLQVTQSVTSAISDDCTVELGGTVLTGNGNGRGHLHAGITKFITPLTAVFCKCDIMEEGFNWQAGASRKLGTHTSCSVTGGQNLESGSSMVLAFQRELSQHMSASWSYTCGETSDNMALFLRQQYEKYMLNWELRYTPAEEDLFVGVSATRQISKRTALKFTGGLNPFTLVPSVAISGSRRTSKHNKLGVGVLFQQDGVVITINYSRGSQKFSFPVIVSDRVTPAVVAASLLIPATVLTLVKWLVINPAKRNRKKRKLQKLREETAEATAMARASAQSAITLMLPTVNKKREFEQQKRGLVIIYACYGNLDHGLPLDGETEEGDAEVRVIDVTVPLNYLVEDSKLILHDNSKSQLLGFYDPCVGEEKRLYIQYLYRDKLHEVTILDDEKLGIPLASHLVKC